MNENTNKNNNRQGFKKKFHPHKKWNNNKNQNNKEEALSPEENELIESEIVETEEILTEVEFIEDVDVDDVAEVAEVVALQNPADMDALPPPSKPRTLQTLRRSSLRNGRRKWHHCT